jgi:methionyl aminopeptidase
MAICIEPMFNLGGDETAVLDDGWTVVTADGSWSCHWENTVALTPDGVQVLTVPADEPVDLAELLARV